MAEKIQIWPSKRLRRIIGHSWHISLMTGWVIMVVWISPWGLVVGAAVLIPCTVFALIHDWVNHQSEFTTDAWAALLVYWFTAFLRRNNPIDVTPLFNAGFTGLTILGIVWFLIDNRARQKRTVS